MEEYIYKIRCKKTGLFFSGKATSLWKLTKKGRSWTRHFDAKDTLVRMHEYDNEVKARGKQVSSKIDPSDLEVVEFRLVFSKVC